MSLSNLVNNLYEGVHKIRCKYGQAIKLKNDKN